MFFLGFHTIKVQFIFVNHERVKSLPELLRNFDLSICRCAIDINGEILIMPECQRDIDNGTVTAYKSVSGKWEKTKKRQEANCFKFNFKPVDK